MNWGFETFSLTECGSVNEGMRIGGEVRGEDMKKWEEEK